jgi:Uma2 family endonuclease
MEPTDSFILWENQQPLRHEWVDGQIVDMVGGSANHARLILRLGARLLDHLRGTPCDVFTSEMKVVAENDVFYPDVVVTCQPPHDSDTVCLYPKLIIEVLSDSTSSYDRTTKRLAYQKIPTLEEYLLVSQEMMHMEIYRRADDWHAMHYIVGSTVDLMSVDLSMPIESIYEKVSFL